MLSSRLIHLIEDHWESITTRTIARIRRDPELSHLAGLADSELRELGESVVKPLGHWLLTSSDEEISRRYEPVGRLRYRETVPLHEAVRGVQILKDCTLDYIRNQGIGQTTLEFYAEEELEHSLGRFFDSMLHHLVRGYEIEMRTPAHVV
jgi:hypothetical protein